MAAWCLVCLAVLVHLDSFHAPQTFFFDEWAFLFDRRSGGIGAFLDPHNGHLSVLPVAAYRVMFSVFGMDRYRPYRMMGLLVHVAVATSVYRYARTRLGDVAGMALGSLVLLLGSGWQNIFWPFQIGYMGSVAAGVIAWTALDRRDRRGTAVASVAVGIALACSGLGIAIFAGTAARLAAERSWRRMVRVLTPSAVAYGAWYLVYGESQGSADNIARVPRFVVDSAANSFAGLAGRDLLWGRLLVGVLIGFAVALVVVGRHIAVTVLAPAVTAVTNWVLTGYSRSDQVDPNASRYVYVGAVLLILVIADVARPFQRRSVRYSVAGLAVLGIWGNTWILDAGAGGLRETTAVTRSELRALEWARPVDPAYRPDTQRMPQVVAGKYFDAADDLGSPAASDGEVLVAAEATRQEVDRVALEVMGLRSPDPTVTAVLPHVSEPKAGCVPATSGADRFLVYEGVIDGGGNLDLSAGESSVEVRLRRYSATLPSAPILLVSPGDTVSLTLGRDTAPEQRWTVELRSQTAFEVCR